MTGEPISSDASTEDKEEAKQEEEATKQELSKILMQFDPLVEDAKKKGGPNSVEAITAAEDSTLNATAALSPSMSLSSSSSPKTPQQLDSPRTSHDVQMAMSEKAKSSLSSKSSSSLSGTTSKKKSERKSTLSPERTTVVDRGMVVGGGSSGNNNRSEPAKPKEVPFDFHKFLEQMRHRSAIPITRYFQR